MARLTAAEASQIIQEEQRQLHEARLPPTLNAIRVLMKDNVFSICNVGPWPYRIERASYLLDIPAYDSQKDAEKLGYAASRPLPIMHREAKQTMMENEYTWIEEDGHARALDLIGVGFGLAPRNSLVQYGVFVPEGKEPTKAELATARQKLSDYYNLLIEEARDAFDKGPEERKAVITERHLLAARMRGLDEKWVHHQHTQESVRCEMCGKYNPSGVAKCQCGTILDIDLYRRIEERQRQMLEGIDKPKK